MSSNGHHASGAEAVWWRRHRVLTAVLLAALLLAVVATVALIQLLGARTQLTAGRADLVAARGALAAGDIGEARGHVDEAQARFRRAVGKLDHPAVWPAGLVPVASGNVDALRVAARATHSITQGLAALLAEVEQIPGGLESLAPRGGRIPLEPFARLREPVQVFAERVTADLAAVTAAADRPLLASVEAAMAELLREGAEAERGVQAAAAAVDALPELLGRDGPRRYFFGAGNPAELRGVGGYLGAYAIVTVDDGRFSFSAFNPIQELQDVDADTVTPPDREFAERYRRYGGAGFWQNINMTADFPLASRAIINLYEHTEGVRLDGVMTADPIALQALAQVTGPVEIPEVGRVQPDDLVAVLANEAFGEFDDNVTRKRVLGAVAAAVFQRFLGGGAEPEQAVEALAKAASGGNLLISSTDERLQEALTRSGVDGGLHRGPGDFLAVAGVNAGANKLDYYAERTVSYDAVLESFGRVRARAEVALVNDAPTEGKPRYVIGPNFGDFAAGETATIVNVYCRGCAITAFERNGVTTPATAERELGDPVFWSYERLRSGESVELAYDWMVPGAWEQGDYLATYRLVVDGQVTIRPTRFDLRVALPDGMTLVSASHDMADDGGVLTWSGPLGPRQEFTITMRPEGSPLWHSLTRWWSDPLVGE